MASLFYGEKELEDFRKEDETFQTALKKAITWRDSYEPSLRNIGLDVDFRDIQYRWEQIKINEDKDKVEIVVVGMTSSGKSAFINALLGKRILKSSMGHCTPCAVSIRLSSGSEPFYQRGTTEPRIPINLNALTSFHNEIDKLNSEHSTETIHVNLPSHVIPRCKVLKKNVTLIDNPGLNQEESKASDISQADAVVLVIDMVTGMNKEETVNVLRESNFFVMPNILIVINKCDELDDEDEDRASDLIKCTIKEITQMLTADNERYKSRYDAVNAIFFISAKQELKQRHGNSSPPGNASISSSFGYRRIEDMYFVDEYSRSLGFMGFERRVLTIANDNLRLMKTRRLTESIRGLQQKLRNRVILIKQKMEKKVKSINDILQSELRVDAGYESKRVAQKFCALHVGDQEEIDCRQVINDFLLECKTNGSRTLDEMFEGIKIDKYDFPLRSLVDKLYKKASERRRSSVREVATLRKLQKYQSDIKSLMHQPIEEVKRQQVLDMESDQINQEKEKAYLAVEIDEMKRKFNTEERKRQTAFDFEEKTFETEIGRMNRCIEEQTARINNLLSTDFSEFTNRKKIAAISTGTAAVAGGAMMFIPVIGWFAGPAIAIGSSLIGAVGVAIIDKEEKEERQRIEASITYCEAEKRRLNDELRELKRIKMSHIENFDTTTRTNKRKHLRTIAQIEGTLNEKHVKERHQKQMQFEKMKSDQMRAFRRGKEMMQNREQIWVNYFSDLYNEWTENIIVHFKKLLEEEGALLRRGIGRLNA